MAISRIITTLTVLFLTLLVVTVWSYPLVNPKEPQEGLYNDLIHVLKSKVDYGSSAAGGSRNRQHSVVDGFGIPLVPADASSHDMHLVRWNPQQLKEITAIQDAIQDVGKRDYGDLGFFFGKRTNSDDTGMQRQNRDYNDLGMFFGKRNGNDVTVDRDFADFAA
ncbi:uncharacterized protein [Apostichopus japonicus]|uniref:Cholecystokinin-type 2 n=1 Tax=Stichopus japonicus TaxID=307972 RepID=A0A2U8RM53_STIJA|nr:DLGMFFFamide precursor [Apostichopus japonicus]AXU40281.1 cholecystokinin-type precursor 2 [Apostichopus japonicus]